MGFCSNYSLRGKIRLKDDQLKYILQQINLDECEELIENYIYYSRRPVRQRCSHGDGTYGYVTDEYEFLIIAENGEKQAIILRCGRVDLHWYVLRKWRKHGVLSNALRTGILKEVWPENKKITCCYGYGDNCEEKFEMTQHLADIAGLILEED